jgi:hypothetical protein
MLSHVSLLTNSVDSNLYQHHWDNSSWTRLRDSSIQKIPLLTRGDDVQTQRNPEGVNVQRSYYWFVLLLIDTWRRDARGCLYFTRRVGRYHRYVSYMEHWLYGILSKYDWSAQNGPKTHTELALKRRKCLDMVTKRRNKNAKTSGEPEYYFLEPLSPSLEDKCSNYEGVSKSFRTESITKYTLTFGITRWEATQRVMVAKFTRLTHKLAIQLHLVLETTPSPETFGYTLVHMGRGQPHCRLGMFRMS